MTPPATIQLMVTPTALHKGPGNHLTGPPAQQGSGPQASSRYQKPTTCVCRDCAPCSANSADRGTHSTPQGTLAVPFTASVCTADKCRFSNYLPTSCLSRDRDTASANSADSGTHSTPQDPVSHHTYSTYREKQLKWQTNRQTNKYCSGRQVWLNQVDTYVFL